METKKGVKTNIYAKLLIVKNPVDYLKKGEKGAQYNYVSSSQTLASLRDKMNDMGLLLIPSVVDSAVRVSTVENIDKYDNHKKTNTYFTELKMNMRWVDVESPSDFIDCPWYGQGVDIAGEKGVGKALTYAEKYFLLKFFNIPTDKDDPDAFQKKNEPTNEQANKPTDNPDKETDYWRDFYKKRRDLIMVSKDPAEIAKIIQEIAASKMNPQGKEAIAKLAQTRINEIENGGK